MGDAAFSTPAQPPHSGGCWTDVLRKPAPATLEEPISSRVFGNLKSSKGISVAVVDANAIIHGDKLTTSAEKFITVSEVLDEVRDPVSRQRLAFLPFHVETMEPSSDAIKKVVKFARETGDLHTLSDVDLKVIALAYMMESQIHGTHHLRESPPPLQTVNVKHIPESDMPGWGKNVSNLEEWEALDCLVEDNNLNSDSKIRPLKYLNSKTVHVSGIVSSNIVGQENADGISLKPTRFNRPEKEINIEGKIVADGIDASKGQCGNDNPDDWKPVVSRSAHRRYLRRKERHELVDGSEKLDQNVECSDIHSDGQSECPEGELASPVLVDVDLNDLDTIVEDDDAIDTCARGLDELEIASQTDASVDMSQTDYAGSKQSWTLRSLSESTVACVTSDFAMQNVILQIGLRLLAPGGMQIHQLRRWVLKCHACNKVTSEVGKIFCPKCGNGGTLRKVSVTVGEYGIILGAHHHRINLRGTKYSLPFPKGGRDGITKNPVLREDQLSKKILHPRKTKNNKQDNFFFSADDIFSHCYGKKGPLKPPVGKSISVFTGKRNPNDNHFSRKKL